MLIWHTELTELQDKLLEPFQKHSLYLSFRLGWRWKLQEGNQRWSSLNLSYCTNADLWNKNIDKRQANNPMQKEVTWLLRDRVGEGGTDSGKACGMNAREGAVDKKSSAMSVACRRSTHTVRDCHNVDIRTVRHQQATGPGTISNPPCL